MARNCVPVYDAGGLGVKYYVTPEAAKKLVWSNKAGWLNKRKGKLAVILDVSVLFKPKPMSGQMRRHTDIFMDIRARDPIQGGLCRTETQPAKAWAHVLRYKRSPRD